MTVALDPGRCTGCPGSAEPPCVRLCPGDLLYRKARPEGDRLLVRHAADCWDCAACVKACPHAALSLVLPPELGGRGSRLTASVSGGLTHWRLTRPDGGDAEFTTPFRDYRR